MRSRKEMERMKPWMRKTFIGIVVLFLMALLAACGSSSHTIQPPSSHRIVAVPQFVQQVHLGKGQAAVIYTANYYFGIVTAESAEDAAATLQSAAAREKTRLEDQSKLGLPAQIYVSINSCKSTPDVWETIWSEVAPAEVKVVSADEINSTTQQLAALHHVPLERITKRPATEGTSC